MAKKRIPKIGDRVAASGQNGSFVVSSVDNDLHSVELKLKGEGLNFSTIPWRALIFLGRHHASPTATRTRIAGEAAEQ